MPEYDEFGNVELALLSEDDFDMDGNPIDEDGNIIKDDEDKKSGGFLSWMKALGESDLFASDGLLSDIWGNFKKDGTPTDKTGDGGDDDPDTDGKKNFVIIASVVFGLLIVIGIAIYFLTREK